MLIVIIWCEYSDITFKSQSSVNSSNKQFILFGDAVWADFWGPVGILRKDGLRDKLTRWIERAKSQPLRASCRYPKLSPGHNFRKTFICSNHKYSTLTNSSKQKK